MSAPTRPTSPLTLALLTAAGSDSSAGTEVVGGSYARQNITLAAASGGATSNTNLVSFVDMPACTVVAVAIYENGGGRIWHGTLTASKTVNAGDTFQVAIGDLDITLG
ncbi:hypothetical protein [Nonomuraea sp. NPDC050786]|uniref:phage tail fiber protein n=1 Tax=Nonomuraea sp. NPDC050786 TaxID=3154840 RepID=UPI0033ED3F04